MKRLAFVVAAACLFAGAPLASRLGPVGASVVAVWTSVLLAIFASGGMGSLAVAGGALGAFGSGVLAPVSPAVAGAVLVAAAFAERTARVRSKTARAVHVGAAVVGGALAGSLSSAFSAAATPTFVVAVVVAALLASLPLLVDADDPLAHALELASRDVGEPARASLLGGAELRRSTEEVPLDRATQERVTKTWRSLLELAEARVRLERTRPRASPSIAGSDDATRPEQSALPSAASAVVAMLDQRIAEHVAALHKAYVAVDTARAAAVSVDTAALQNVESIGESLEAVSRALVEVEVEQRAELRIDVEVDDALPPASRAAARG